MYVLNEGTKITAVLPARIALIFRYVCYYHFLKKIKILQIKLKFLLSTTFSFEFIYFYSRSSPIVNLVCFLFFLWLDRYRDKYSCRISLYIGTHSGTCKHRFCLSVFLLMSQATLCLSLMSIWQISINTSKGTTQFWRKPFPSCSSK